MSETIIEGVIGWSVGYSYSIEKTSEDEIKQGRNHYLSSMLQCAQLAQVCVLISKINEFVPVHPLRNVVKIACNIAPILCLPPFLFCAAAKQGEHEKVAKWFNGTRYAYVKIPETLHRKTVTVLSFFAEHNGNIFRVTMVAASVGLIALGNVVYGGAVLTAIAYEAIDSMGFVPRRISLFMEIYMPIVSNVGLLVGGTVFIRVFAAINLSTYLYPPFVNHLHERIDAMVRPYFKLQGASLKELNAPVVQKRKMTFDEINQILDANQSEFKVNPAHYGHLLMDMDKLPRDHDFEKFLTLFDAIDWESKYDPLILGKLKDDDRFIDLLLNENPGKTKDDIRSDVESYIEPLAEKEQISNDRFAANWLREQMVSFVAKLQGKKRARGLQQDLDEAIQDSAILLPYIASLQDANEQEDALLKLAVEGGDYCARGIKRTTNELIRGIIQAGIQQEDDPEDTSKNLDPTRLYEMQILQSLQNCRHDIVQSIYRAILQQYKVPNAIGRDTHNFDRFRTQISFGFYPLTKHERKRMGLSELFGWECFHEVRANMYSAYRVQLDQVVADMGNVHFTDYLQRILNENDQLTQAQRDELIDKFVEMNDGNWGYVETLVKFHTLMFVRLGVLIPIDD